MRCLLVAGAALLCAGGASATPAVQATLPLGSNTEGIAVDRALGQGRIYVTNHDSGTVSVVDVGTLSVMATIPVGANPLRIAADSATHRVYVTNASTPGTLTVIDGTTNAVIATVPVGDNSRGLGVNFYIHQVYVSNNAANTVSVIDTTTDTVTATIPVDVGPGGIASNNILYKAYVPSFTSGTVTVIDEKAHTALKIIPVGKGPIAATIDAQHAKVYVNNGTDKTVSVIDSNTDTVVATLPVGAGITGGNPNFIVVNAAYHRAYLPNGVDNTMSVIDTDALAVIATVPVGTMPIDMIADGNGGNLYVVNQGSDNVSILDATTNAVIDTLPVGNAPWRIADGLDHLFVLNTNGASADSITIAAEENTDTDTEIATEFYHAEFDHYFHTADEVETNLLLDGLFNDDWHRTFQFFRVWSVPAVAEKSALALSPVCRFFSTAFGAKSSHFYTPFPDECQKLQTDPALSGTWQLESASVYYLALADANGVCPPGTVPLYRTYNNGMGGAPNHRYMTDRAIRDQMVQAGWVAEGAGPDTVFACVPPILGP